MPQISPIRNFKYQNKAVNFSGSSGSVFSKYKQFKSDQAEKIYNKIPTIGIDPDGKLINTLSGIGGWNQRLIMGITAILTQPFIDYNNKKVDERTRKYSTIKTVVKTVVGTTVGVMVRLGTLKVAQKFLVKGSDEIYSKAAKKVSSEINKGANNGILWPFGDKGEDFIRTARKSITEKTGKTVDKAADNADIKAYAGSIGTALGVAVSLVTNFVIDAPLTKFFTNVYADKYGLSSNKKEAK